MSRSIALFALILLATLTLGCGSSGPAMELVSGKISKQDGKPCDNALVVFHPQDPKRLNDPKPFAKTDSQGAFQLTTQIEGDGALIGNYGVTIVWHGVEKQTKLSLSGEGQGSSVDKLNGKYANPNKPLFSVEVKEGTENRFDLTVEE